MRAAKVLWIPDKAVERRIGPFLIAIATRVCYCWMHGQATTLFLTIRTGLGTGAELVAFGCDPKAGWQDSLGRMMTHTCFDLAGVISGLESRKRGL